MSFFEITSCEDQTDYETFKNVRGPIIYEFIAEYCCQKLKTSVVDYKLIRNIIKYEKRLKDNLYIYFGTYEDHLKGEISSKTRFDTTNGKKEFVLLKNNEENDGSSFNQINNNIYTLHDLSLELENLNLLGDYPNLDKIRKFRNQVMHFNFLLFKKENNKFESSLNNLKKNIEFLKNGLPLSYQSSLLKSINKTKIGLEKTHKGQISKFLMEDLK